MSEKLTRRQVAAGLASSMIVSRVASAADNPALEGAAHQEGQQGGPLQHRRQFVCNGIPVRALALHALA